MASLFLKRLLDTAEGVRFDLVLELTEGFDVGWRNEVRPSRQDLPHLDKGRSQFLEGSVDLFRVLLVVEVAEKMMAAHHLHYLPQTLPFLYFNVGLTIHADHPY